MLQKIDFSNKSCSFEQFIHKKKKKYHSFHKNIKQQTLLIRIIINI